MQMKPLPGPEQACQCSVSTRVEGGGVGVVHHNVGLDHVTAGCWLWLEAAVQMWGRVPGICWEIDGFWTLFRTR